MCDGFGEFQDGLCFISSLHKIMRMVCKAQVCVSVGGFFFGFFTKVSFKYVKVGSKYLLKHLTNQHLIQKCGFIYLIYCGCTGKYKHRAAINVTFNLEYLKLLIITFHRAVFFFLYSLGINSGWICNNFILFISVFMKGMYLWNPQRWKSTLGRPLLSPKYLLSSNSLSLNKATQL